MLTIAASVNVERLRQRLQHGLRELERQGVRVFSREQARGEYTYLSVGLQGFPARPEGAAMWQDVLRRQLAVVLCEVIVSDFRELLLRRIVTSRYPQLGTSERETVVAYAQRYLREEGAEEALRRGVLLRLLDYMRDSPQLIVEGFITFRLKEYVEQLEDAVERAIDEILLEREYQEFVRLLQGFVAAQEPRLAEVHLLCREDGLVLEDAERHPLCLRVAAGVRAPLRSEDLVVSGLVSLSPGRVVIHGSPATDDDRAIVDAVVRIFAHRVIACPGCPRCSPRT